LQFHFSLHIEYIINQPAGKGKRGELTTNKHELLIRYSVVLPYAEQALPPDRVLSKGSHHWHQAGSVPDAIISFMVFYVHRYLFGVACQRGPETQLFRDKMGR
jgi:hypothetical protein